MGNLLIELFSEEIPAGLQEIGAKNLEHSFLSFLQEEGVKFGKSKIFWSPMRITLGVKNVNSSAENIEIEKRGPRKDAHELAITGFAKSIGVKVSQLIIEETSKGHFYFYRYTKKGENSIKIIERALKKVINNFSWSKSMRWGSGSLKWVRPLHSILCIYDKKPIIFTIADIKSGNFTYGHRFISPKKIIIKKYQEYLPKLKKAHVVIDANKRIELIKINGEKLSRHNNLIFKPSESLLNEVASLVENPYLFIAEFDKDYLSLPEEILKLTMMKHQKYFPLMSKSNKISNKFIGVSNVPIYGEQIILGNSKVLKARLDDARFFYKNDINKGLNKFSKDLKNIIFHTLLGTMDSKVDRIKFLINIYAQIFKADKKISLVSADLAKADLCSEVVYEMPELQGIIGSKYAEIEGLSRKISSAIKEHYSPLGPNDKCPLTPESALLSFIDKIDTLIGFMAINLKPTGSKDPFGIRRSGLGIIRIILENKIRVSIRDVYIKSYRSYLNQNTKLVHNELETINISSDFLMERLKGYIREIGVSQSSILSVCNTTKSDDIFDIVQKIYALDNFVKTKKGKIFIQNLKRVRRILSIEEKKERCVFEGKIVKSLLKEKEEKELYNYYIQINKKTHELLKGEMYEKAMLTFLKIENKLDKFFDNVQINVDNKNIRINRLNILSSIRKTFIDFADFSLIEIENEVK